jgi:hypothetical protein
MKTVLLWLCVLSTARCSSGTGDLKFEGPPSTMKFSLTSYRNKTGHWKAQVSKQNHILVSFRLVVLRRLESGTESI